jgi:hypothetical protein
MLYNLPTTVQECNAMSCDDIQHGYILLTTDQKKEWLQAAGNAGCIRLTQPADINAIQINVFDPTANDFSRCNWQDRDPFDT